MHPHHHSDGISLFSYLPILLIAVLFFIYISMVSFQRKQGKKWPFVRILSFSSAIVLLGAALWPPFHHYAMLDIRIHMLQHLLIGMIAPIGLVFGAPISLALKSLPKSTSRSLAKLLHSQTLRYLSHPFIALVLSVGGMFAIYLTPIFQLSHSHTTLYVFIHIHFILAGYLFAWSIAGIDPVFKRPRFQTRLIAIFLAIAAHGGLSKIMYAYNFPRGTDYNERQIQSAAQIMYYGGDFAEGLLVIALFTQWYRRRRIPYSEKASLDFNKKPLLV